MMAMAASGVGAVMMAVATGVVAIASVAMVGVTMNDVWVGGATITPAAVGVVGAAVVVWGVVWVATGVHMRNVATISGPATEHGTLRATVGFLVG